MVSYFLCELLMAFSKETALSRPDRSDGIEEQGLMGVTAVFQQHSASVERGLIYAVWYEHL